MYFEEYKNVILKIMNEMKLLDLPILYNMNFGYTPPMKNPNWYNYT